jgi:hypothetical protein
MVNDDQPSITIHRTRKTDIAISHSIYRGTGWPEEIFCSVVLTGRLRPIAANLIEREPEWKPVIPGKRSCPGKVFRGDRRAGSR